MFGVPSHDRSFGAQAGRVTSTGTTVVVAAVAGSNPGPR
jgi:hypothetical protein